MIVKKWDSKENSSLVASLGYKDGYLDFKIKDFRLLNKSNFAIDSEQASKKCCFLSPGYAESCKDGTSTFVKTESCVSIAVKDSLQDAVEIYFMN